MLQLDAAIEPGRGLGGIAIGCAVDDVLAHAKPVRVIELPGDDEDPQGVTIHSFGAIRTWSVGGVVVPVGAFDGYAGRTAAGIGIGSTVAELAAVHEDVVAHEAEGVVVLPDTPGVGIETTEWSTEDEPDPAATIVQIFVHATAG